MINLLDILITTLAVLFVIVRAAQLDRRLPWFTPAPRPPAPDAAGSAPPGFPITGSPITGSPRAGPSRPGGGGGGPAPPRGGRT